MFHLLLFRLPAPGAVVGADMPAVEDPSITLSSSGHPIFEQDIQIPLAYAFGSPALQRVQIATPKLRAFPLPNVVPVDAAGTPTSRPPFQDWYERPLSLLKIDEIQSLAFDLVGAFDDISALWVHDGNYASAQGPTMNVHGSAAIPAVADTWTPGGFVLDQALPAGQYVVTGMRVTGLNMAFARLIFPKIQQPGGMQWRPGVLAGPNASWIGIHYLKEGRIGNYGQFSSFAQPQLDIYTHGGAGTTQDVYLDLVKVA